MTAGYNGTWNGLPSFAQSNSVDGTIGNTNRWREQTLNSAQNTAITPRLENIAEMVVSSDQLDMSSTMPTTKVRAAMTCTREKVGATMQLPGM